MVLSKGTDYSFHKVFLYPAGNLVKESTIPHGKVDIMVNGAKGRLNWYLTEAPDTGRQDLGERLAVVLFNESNGQALRIGSFAVSNSEMKGGSWDFNTASAASGNSEELVRYSIKIIAENQPGMQNIAAEGSGTENKLSGNRVILEGVILLSAELNDNRVIGLNREVKTTQSAPKSPVNNIFLPIQPFMPPLPNIRWWQISILPDFENNYRQPAFCPRQKKRAVY
ncbi:hypothetical protein [Phosphitispora fastidiosa]|uniref:hypothetical protein n=1 Tax=Phosphitispora fastidiosa TaxID=2837202 RepID=UPI001E32F4CE|nr:hypothetical protein [Phosphitispora fastidiosa]MBU7007811.1 hypothetical protein [Phosphitispora fastidiosa]